MTYVTAAARKTALTTWEGIWYVLQCIAFGAGYFGKIPAKKAMSDFGLTELTGAEHFWYILMCIGFGAGYFAKIPTAKALSELPQFQSQRQSEFTTLSATPAAPTIPSAPPAVPLSAHETEEPAQPSVSMPESPPDTNPLEPPKD